MATEGEMRQVMGVQTSGQCAGLVQDGQGEEAATIFIIFLSCHGRQGMTVNLARKIAWPASKGQPRL